MKWMQKTRLMVADRTILIYVQVIVFQEYVLLQVMIVSARNHQGLGRNSMKS